MIIITGPQSTDEERGRLAEMAGLLDARTVADVDEIDWAAVTDLYSLAGWEDCSTARADVKIAELFGLTVTHLAT